MSSMFPFNAMSELLAADEDAPDREDVDTVLAGRTLPDLDDDDAVVWCADEDHGADAVPLPICTPDILLECVGTPDAPGPYQAIQVIGAFWRTPLHIDLEWILQPGPDPLPLTSLELSRVATAIRQGGAVAVYATERAAIDTVLRVIEPILRPHNA